jgi:hypothetical protein
MMAIDGSQHIYSEFSGSSNYANIIELKAKVT